MTGHNTVEVALVQFQAEPGDVTGNVARLVEYVREYGPEADLVVAPELATTGYDLDLVHARGADLAETREGRTLAQLKKACSDAG
ncbi:MAG: nitrilase-related carbon-nitrogen hydrolase, partial [Actinomycetes bacterium]